MDSSPVNDSNTVANVDDDACWRYHSMMNLKNYSVAAINPELASRVSDNTVGPVKKRRTISGKCECREKLQLKICLIGYEVSRFEDDHNHPLAIDSENPFLRVNRCMTAILRNFAFNVASSNTVPVRAFNFLKSLRGSYVDVGAIAIDFKNWMRDIKISIGKNDANLILQKFKDKKETLDNTFFYDYETDSNGYLTRLFWADLEGQRSYDVFGDVLSFDATYRTNK
ncbi:protein FAR1-RELATED SEQUENCE 5-like [Apium graveolens]|uniref:protein FAR1-RELATED SEQUENCE 5-like n=1 Tax=Apium graveolens TaxID=4045 RepID=UPI003D78D9CD